MDGGGRYSWFDFRNPDYDEVFLRRHRNLLKIKALDADGFKKVKQHYKEYPADFIQDWGYTFDPRNAGTGVPVSMPFILFPRQREWIEWTVERWKSKEYGLTDKSRDMGLSWLAVGLAATLCIFHEGMVVGFGSRKEEYVDKLGDPKCLFFKLRMFIEKLPRIFLGDWNRNRDAPHMRVMFPSTGSVISGESGDNIGRGDRAGIYFVDEAAYIERPQLVEAALSQTTNCRIDISSANGMANPFAQKRHDGKHKVFTFHWKSDPRKDEAWYAAECEKWDAVVVAQEIDINYSASTVGAVIKNEWIQAATDAHLKLGWEPSGARYGALDVADEGKDKNAFCGAHGPLVERITEWAGTAAGIYQTTVDAFGHCDDLGYELLVYDADGLGAGVKGDGIAINRHREAEGISKIKVVPFRGSAKVRNPEREDTPGRKNEDYFANAKAQSWWALRQRFQRTYQAVKEGMQFSPDQLISLPKTLDGYEQLCNELQQVVYVRNDAGKILIDKTPEGMPSPNKADALMMRFGMPLDLDGDFFARTHMLEAGEAIDIPKACDAVFATFYTSVKPGHDVDATAVIYWAMNRLRTRPLILLDWDVVELKGTVIARWLPKVFGEIEKWRSACGARLGSAGLWVDDKISDAVVLKESARLRQRAQVIQTKITNMERAIKMSPFVASKRVRLARPATERSVEYKGIDQNHLLYQLGSFSASSKDIDTMALLNAFTHGIAIGLEDAEGQ